MMKMARLAAVAIHDVAPCFLEQVRRKRNFLLRQGVGEFSYLVVPQYSGKESQDIRRNPEFLDFLMSEGRELALHGFTHKGFMGEFSRIKYDNAVIRLEKGIDYFSEAFGRRPEGFVPPVWGLSKLGLRAVVEEGFNYAALKNSFYYIKGNRRFKSIIVIRGGPLTINSVLDSALRIEMGAPIQIALHPKDNMFKLSIIKQLITLVKKKGYEFVSYRDFAKKV
jgi:predicted deacetylase